MVLDSERERKRKRKGKQNMESLPPLTQGKKRMELNVHIPIFYFSSSMLSLPQFSPSFPIIVRLCWWGAEQKDYTIFKPQLSPETRSNGHRFPSGLMSETMLKRTTATYAVRCKAPGLASYLNEMGSLELELYHVAYKKPVLIGKVKVNDVVSLVTRKVIKDAYQVVDPNDNKILGHLLVQLSLRNIQGEESYLKEKEREKGKENEKRSYEGKKEHELISDVFSRTLKLKETLDRTASGRGIPFQNQSHSNFNLQTFDSDDDSLSNAKLISEMIMADVDPSTKDNINLDDYESEDGQSFTFTKTRIMQKILSSNVDPTFSDSHQKDLFEGVQSIDVSISRLEFPTSVNSDSTFHVAYTIPFSEQSETTLSSQNISKDRFIIFNKSNTFSVDQNLIQNKEEQTINFQISETLYDEIIWTGDCSLRISSSNDRNDLQHVCLPVCNQKNQEKEEKESEVKLILTVNFDSESSITQSSKMDSSQHWKQINDDQLLSLRIRIRGVKILLKEMKRIVVSCKILSQQETVAQELLLNGNDPEFNVDQTIPLESNNLNFLSEKILVFELWGSNSSGFHYEANEKLIGIAKFPLAFAVDNYKQNDISGQNLWRYYTVNDILMDTTNGVIELFVEIIPRVETTKPLIDSNGNTSEMKELHHSTFLSFNQPFDETGNVQIPKTENDQFSFNSTNRFVSPIPQTRMHFLIEKGLHIPFTKWSNIYVCFSWTSLDEKKFTKISLNQNPIWNAKFTIDVPTTLADLKNKEIEFQVFHRPKEFLLQHTVDEISQHDEYIGSSKVDLSLLACGFTEIDGWYLIQNEEDEDQDQDQEQDQLRGQLKVKIYPEPEVSKFVYSFNSNLHNQNLFKFNGDVEEKSDEKNEEKNIENPIFSDPNFSDGELKLYSIKEKDSDEEADGDNESE